MRDIDSILFFRNDISPFLVHLTRKIGDREAKTNLMRILRTKRLKYGNAGISDAKYGFRIQDITTRIEKRFFSAISFTETPLNEIHNLLEISGRQIDLEPYGLVFLKKNLKENGVSPVIYINNVKQDKDDLVQALCSLITSHPNEAEKILPYISVFGKMFRPVGGISRGRDIDFTWEREWRYASNDYLFRFEMEDVFIGLCPHEEIGYFENKFPELSFIDPRRNTKWYAEKLLSARHRSDIDNSVV